MRKLLIAACTMLMACLALIGCGDNGAQASDSALTLEAPTSIKMSSKGVLSWEEVDNATSYEIVVGDAITTVESEKQDLFALITAPGDYTVTITAKNAEVTSESASYSFTAVKLPTPSQPVLEADPTTHAVQFVWTGGENTRTYAHQVNGGKWINNANSYYSISSTGTYMISVKAKGYAANNVLYLDSDASLPSETYEHQQGPVLSLLEMCLIDWTVEDGFEVDCYNLWVNGEKVKENIERVEGGYDLVFSENPAITKTGEYNVQIEAVKGDNSYWSNVLYEIGTYNINPGEIYSFDNRVAKFPVAKDGVSVSNEQYHGDSGYSLRFDAQNSEQINLAKYAADSHANDIDYLTIKKISYWVYIEPIEGFEGNFPASDLPAAKWERELKDGSYQVARFPATQDVPFGEWVKVEIDNIQMAYDNVLILQYAKLLDENYVIYIDDITFEEVWEEVTVADAEYEVKYTASASQNGSWQAFNPIEIDFGAENANKTLTVTMQVCGNAPASIENGSLGIFNDVAPNVAATDAHQFIWIDTDKISSLYAWNTITIELKTNSEGKCYLAGVYNQSADKIAPYSIFIKGIEVEQPEDPSTVGGTIMPSGTEKTENANGYYQAFAGLSTEYEAGTLVTVKMDIYVTGTYDQYSGGIRWVDTVYSEAGGEVDNAPTILDIATITAKKGEWITVEFEATVRNFAVLRANSAYATVDTSSYGNAIYLFAKDFKSAESFNYKNVVVTEKVVEEPEIPEEPEVPTIGGTEMPTGTQKTNPDKFYQSAVGLPTEYAVGTFVKVSMDVYVTGTTDEYSYISWVDTVWGDNAVNAETKVATYEAMSANVGVWMHVEFYAFVRDFDLLRRDNSYPTIDVSSTDRGVFIMAANFTSAATFNYNNVVITAAEDAVGKAVPNGTQKTANPNNYYQAFVGLSTDYAVGTMVTVKMDVYITGSYDQYSDGIRWVDTVWTADGGEVNAATKIVDIATITANQGKWITVEFEATVRNFAVLRANPDYATIDTSSYGNAIYLFAKDFKSAASFNYKNVTITAEDPGVAMPSGTQKTANPNNYYQAFVGLSTDYAAGTQVKVTMQIYITGSYDQYSDGIRWVDTVWTADGGEVNVATKIVDIDAITANQGKWITVEFEATVRNFAVLRANPDYATIDTSSYGNAIYLFAKDFKSAESFNYRNVVITEA